MRVVVVSDTHAPGRWKGLPAELLLPLAEAEVILHAGDVCTAGVLDDLAQFAPVHVVMGNNDGSAVQGWGARPILEVELGGLRIGMVHDSGTTQGRGRRLRRLFPHAGLVVFGHSHAPFDGTDAGVRLFNPGSTSDPRAEPVGTYGVLEIIDGTLVTSTIIAIEATRRVSRNPTSRV